MTLNTGGNAPGVFEFEPGQLTKVHERIKNHASKTTEKGVKLGELFSGKAVAQCIRDKYLDWGLSQDEMEGFVRFFDAHAGEVAVSFLYKLPESLFSGVEKNLKDDVLSSNKDRPLNFNTIYPTLDTLVPLKENLVAQKELMDKLMTLSAYDKIADGGLKRAEILNTITENQKKLEDGNDRFKKGGDLALFATAKGQLLMYGIFQCMILEQVFGQNSSVTVDDVNREKEKFKKGFDTATKANTLAQTILNENPSVLFTQEQCGDLSDRLEKQYICAEGQAVGDGTLVYLDRDRWKDIKEVRSQEEDPSFWTVNDGNLGKKIGDSLESEKLNFVKATHRASGKEFLFVAVHSKSGGSSDPIKAQWEKIQAFAGKHFPDAYIVVWADANTEKDKTEKEGVGSWQECMKELKKEHSGFLDMTEEGYTSAKTRLLTTQFSKQGDKKNDPKDYIWIYSPNKNGTVCLEKTRVVGKNSLLTAEHPSDHGAVETRIYFPEKRVRL